MTLVFQIIKKTVIQVHRPKYEHRSFDEDSTNQKPYTMHLVLVQYNVLTFISPATLPLSHTHQGQRYSDKKRTCRAENHKEAATAKLSTSTQRGTFIFFLKMQWIHYRNRHHFHNPKIPWSKRDSYTHIFAILTEILSKSSTNGKRSQSFGAMWIRSSSHSEASNCWRDYKAARERPWCKMPQRFITSPVYTDKNEADIHL